MEEKEMTREEVVKHNLKLREQLQAYKDRERKALNYLIDNSGNGNVDTNGIGEETSKDFEIQKLGQILNERGSDE